MVRSSFLSLVLSLGLAISLAAQSPEPIRLAGLANAPRLLTRVDPTPPDEARAGRVSGIVGLDLVVGIDGSVTGATVTRSVPQLDQAAIDAALQWKYEPTLLNGVPVAVIVNVSVRIPSPVRVGGMVRPPTKVKNVDAVYPRDMWTAGVEGIVILELLVGVDGRVADTKVLKSVPGLDEAAEAAAREWEYLPTLLNGNPVPILYNVTVTFRLS